MKTILALVTLLGFAVGCGDDTAPGGGGSGGDGGSGGSGANGGGGEGGEGGSLNCDAYLEQEGPPVQTVVLTVRNQSANPVFLGLTQPTCFDQPLYRAETEAGDPIVTDLGSCERTCSQLAQGGCECAADCAQPQVTMIHPGGVAELSWTAVVYEDQTMPAGCYFEPTCAMATCVSAVQPSGPIAFFVDAYPELGDCAEAICDCDGGEAGSCVVEGATLVSGTPLSVSSIWNPSDEAIEIVID